MLRSCREVGRLSESWAAFSQAFRSRELRRLQLAGAGSTLAVWAYSIAIAVYAYREDGAKAVGIVLFARWSLAAVFAPWLALLADRVSRRRVMMSVDLSRVVLVGGMTVVAARGGPSLLTYALAIVMSVISTAFNPAQAALLPSLAKTPDELTASNLALNTISSVGMFAGPAIGGVLLAASGPWLVFALAGCSYLWSAACVSGLPRDAPPRRARGQRDRHRAPGRLPRDRGGPEPADRRRADRGADARRRRARGRDRRRLDPDPARRQRRRRLAEHRARRRRHPRRPRRRRARDAQAARRRPSPRARRVRRCARASRTAEPARRRAPALRGDGRRQHARRRRRA